MTDAARTAPAGVDPRDLRACALGLALGALASWARLFADGTPRLDSRRASWLLACAVAGAGLVWAGLAALRLLRAAPDPGRALRAALLVHLCAFPAAALTSSDLFSNLAYAALSAAGKNPYLAGPAALGEHPLLALVDPRWAGAPSAYGPLLTALGSLAGRAGAALHAPLLAGGLAYKLLLLLAALGTLAFGSAAARALGTPAAARGFALLAFSPLFAWEITAQAHNDGAMVCALAAFALAAARGRDGLAALALVLGTLAKFAAAPLLLLWLAVVFRRAPARAAGLALGAAGLALLAWAPYWEGPATLLGPAATAGASLDRHAHSLHDLLDLVLAPALPSLRAPLYRLFQLGSLAWLAGGTLLAATQVRSAAGVARAGTWVLLGWFLLTPWFQPWYATWLLPLALLEEDPRWQRLVAVYGVLTVVQWAAPLDPVTTVAGNAWVARELFCLRPQPPPR